MKVSLVTAVLNGVSTLGDTLKSILDQTYRDIECIVIDGGSTDGTVELIKEYESKFGDRLKWISEPDNGLFNAMNKGLRMATGDLVAIINSDDYYHRNDIVELIVKNFEDDKNVQAVYGDVRFVSRYNTNKVVRYYSSSIFVPNKFKYGFMPAHPTFFTYRKYYEKWGMFRTDMPTSADFDLLLRFLYSHKLNAKYIKTDFLTMRTGGMSYPSFANTRQVNREVRKICKENGVKTNYILLYSRYFRKIKEWFPYFYKG